MTRRATDDLLAELAADPAARPLAPPMQRAFGTLAVISVPAAITILFFSDTPGLLARYAGRLDMMMLEMAAMLATGAIAIAAAFHLAIPGRSKAWLLAPTIPFAAWMWLSGLGCYRDFVRRGPSGWEPGHGGDCLIFILTVGAALAVPLLWRLSRARPINPIPVALLGGLGTASLAAFLLQFFHPFAVTVLDLAAHLAGIAMVVGATILLNRKVLAPA